jgi:hypothetical protein
MPLTLNDAATGQIYEVVYVTAISGVTLTVTRAQEGTGAQNWNIGDFAYCAPTAGTVAMINGNPVNQFQVAPATASNQAPQASQIQQNALTYAADTGAANAYAVALSPAPTLVRGAIIGFTAAHANTGASTLAVNGGTAFPIWGSAHSALQGGEIALNGYIEVEYNPTLNGGNPVYVLLENTGGATQVAPATASGQAVQFGQVAGVVGQCRNLKMSLTAPSATATLTADEVIVESALGGLRYCVASPSLTINLATTGAGGMDTGSAPANGYVGIYLILNPVTGTAALLAVNTGPSVLPNIYASGHMPAGFTASALVSVLPTNSSGQFVQFYQRDRRVSIIVTQAFQTSGVVTVLTPFTLSSIVPPNATHVGGTTSLTATAASFLNLDVAGDASGPGGISGKGQRNTGANQAGTGGFSDVPLITQQTIYYQSTSSGGTPTFQLNISDYTF